MQENDLVHVDEHLKMKERIVEGPCGEKAVVLEIEDDVHVDEVIKKNEKYGENLHTIKSTESNNNPCDLMEKGEASVGSDHRRRLLHHHQIEHKE